jgi:hypothetical protein
MKPKCTMVRTLFMYEPLITVQALLIITNKHGKANCISNDFRMSTIRIWTSFLDKKLKVKRLFDVSQAL